MNAQHSIQIGDPSCHNEAFLRTSRDWYDQGLFTDCRIVVEGQLPIECHRMVLSAHSPALRNLLLAGLTEISVTNISYDIVECIVMFMYDGSLFCTITEIPKFIEAAITFEMTDLVNALCCKVQNTVTPSNVTSWRKFADRFRTRIPLILDICDRIIKKQFFEVVQHQKFLALPVDEMVDIILLCKPAADSIGHDLLLKAAVSWMEEHPDDVDKCEQLWYCIQLDDCSKSTLLSAMEIDGTPQDLIRNAVEKWDKSLQQNTVAFLFDDKFVIMNDEGDFKDIQTFQLDQLSCYVCGMTNGFVVIVEGDYISDTEVTCRILTCTLPHLQETEVSIGHHKPTGVDWYSVHNNKLYLVPYENKMHIECFNLEDRSWSRIPNPKYPSVHRWNTASIGEDVYFINREMYLLRLRDGKFTEISTVELSERLPRVHGERTFVITAIRDSLYIFVTYSDSKSFSFTKIYVYKTHGEQSGWMSIAGTFECVPNPDVKPLWFKSDDSILIVCMVHTNHDTPTFCEFDVKKGIMKRSKFPCAGGSFQVVLIDH